MTRFPFSSLGLEELQKSDPDLRGISHPGPVRISNANARYSGPNFSKPIVPDLAGNPNRPQGCITNRPARPDPKRPHDRRGSPQDHPHADISESALPDRFPYLTLPQYPRQSFQFQPACASYGTQGKDTTSARFHMIGSGARRFKRSMCRQNLNPDRLSELQKTKTTGVSVSDPDVPLHIGRGATTNLRPPLFPPHQHQHSMWEIART